MFHQYALYPEPIDRVWHWDSSPRAISHIHLQRAAAQASSSREVWWFYSPALWLTQQDAGGNISRKLRWRLYRRLCI